VKYKLAKIAPTDAQFIIRWYVINKFTNDVAEYCYFFRKAFTRFDFKWKPGLGLESM